MLWQHDMRHDRTSGLVLLVRYLMKSWDIRDGLLLLSATDKVAIRACLEANSFPDLGSGALVAGAPAKAGATASKKVKCIDQIGRALIVPSLLSRTLQEPRSAF
jgi:hypothetical protein